MENTTELERPVTISFFLIGLRNTVSRNKHFRGNAASIQAGSPKRSFFNNRHTESVVRGYRRTVKT